MQNKVDKPELDKVAKVRLDKVLAIIEKVGMRFPVAQIEKEMKENKGNVSAYLSGKKPISENFYNTFLKKYGPLDRKGLNFDSEGEGTQSATLFNLSQSLLVLSESRKIDAESELILAKTNASLTEKVISMGQAATTDPEILQALNSNMRGLLSAIVKVATGMRFPTEAQAVQVLSKIVHEQPRKVKSKGRLNVAGS